MSEHQPATNINEHAPYEQPDDAAGLVAGNGITIEGNTIAVSPSVVSSSSPAVQSVVLFGPLGLLSPNGTYSLLAGGTATIGDGSKTPLSAVFATLAAAQVVYPSAVALTNWVDGCATQKAFDAGSVVSFYPGANVCINSGVFLDGASNLPRYVLNGNGATLTAGKELPTPSGWNTTIGAAPPTVFFNGTLRAGLSGGSVNTSSEFGSSNSPFGARLIVRDLIAVAESTSTCLAFGGEATNKVNGAASGLYNVVLNKFIAGISWVGYADLNFAEHVEVGANPAGNGTRILYQTQDGDGTRIIHCKAYGGYLAQLESCKGFKVESCVGGQFKCTGSVGEIVAGHQEATDNSNAVPWSIEIDRSHVTIDNTYTEPSGVSTKFSVRVNDSTTEKLYVASEVYIKGWVPRIRYAAATGDVTRGPDLYITNLNPNGKVQLSDCRGQVISEGVSVGYRAVRVESAVTAIGTALTAGADYIATGNWTLKYNGSWAVSTSNGATPTPYAFVTPTVAGVADASLSGGTLTSGKGYSYIAAVKNAAGAYSPLSGAVEVTATASGIADLTITNPTGATTIALWRKKGAGVAAEPDHYIEIGLDAYQTAWIDTGANLNGREWRTTSLPVPNNVAGTGLQFMFLPTACAVFVAEGHTLFGQAVAATTFGLTTGAPTGSYTFSGSTGAISGFYLDPTRYPAWAQLDLRLGALCNNAAPGVNFTAKLFAISAPTGAEGVISVTAAEDAASAVLLEKPAANSAGAPVNSGNFPMPVSAGWYAIGCVSSGTTAAKSETLLRAELHAVY